jgi:hypothetical protein
MLISSERDALLASVQNFQNEIFVIFQERMELKASKRELRRKNQDLCDELSSCLQPCWK